MTAFTETSPLTFDLKQDQLARLSLLQERFGMRTLSEVVRMAISRFDISEFDPVQQPHRQISVRLPGTTKTRLLRAAREKSVSIGELVRVALDKLSAHATVASPRKPKNHSIMATKKAAKKPVKKAAKKAAKKKK